MIRFFNCGSDQEFAVPAHGDSCLPRSHILLSVHRIVFTGLEYPHACLPDGPLLIDARAGRVTEEQTLLSLHSLNLILMYYPRARKRRTDWSDP